MSPGSALSLRADGSGYGLATWLRLAGVIVLWGGNWPVMKLALRYASPMTFSATRVIGAALVILLVQLCRGRPVLPDRGERIPLALIGLLQVGGILALGMLGLQFISAGRGAVLTYTFQLWVMLIGIIFLGASFDRRKVLAAAIGFGGLLLFFNPSLVDWRSARALFGNALVLTGAICWAVGATLYRRRTWTSDAWSQTAWQLMASSLPLALMAVTLESGRPVLWDWPLLAIILFNWVGPTALAYWCWSKVLEAMPAASAGQVLMLSPVFGFLLSAAVFGEQISLDVVASIGLIVVGLVLSLSPSSRA